MSWFKSSSKHPEEIRVSQVRFLGEQDGPPEKILKGRLTEFFQRDKSVQRAYLAKINLGTQDGVALCLKTQFGTDRGMAEKVGGIFAMVFNAQEHLDIIFLSHAQEDEVSKLCKPFFVA